MECHEEVTRNAFTSHRILKCFAWSEVLFLLAPALGSQSLCLSMKYQVRKFSWVW